MTAVNTGNVVIAKNGKTITIATEPNDEENLTKPLTVLTFPALNGAEANDSNILDLLQPERRITIDGFLVKGVDDTDTSLTAAGKKADLKQAFLDGGVMDMTYEGATFKVNMDKLSIKRVPTDNNGEIDGVIEFSVKFTAIRGVNLGVQ